MLPQYLNKTKQNKQTNKRQEDYEFQARLDYIDKKMIEQKQKEMIGSRLG